MLAYVIHDLIVTQNFDSGKNSFNILGLDSNIYNKWLTSSRVSWILFEVNHKFPLLGNVINQYKLIKWNWVPSSEEH